jgi:hypothetical protein
LNAKTVSAEGVWTDAQPVADLLQANLSQAESELLQRINQGVPVAVQERYDELIGRRREETLTAQDYDELLDLAHQVEMLEAERVRALVDLARLRGVSPDDLSKLKTQP